MGKRKTTFATTATFAGMALVLSACFQNMSGSESLYTKKASQSGFIDSGPVGGGSFDGTILQATAAVVNTYSGVDSNNNYNGSFGIVINLEKSFATAIGTSVLNDLVKRAAEPAVASMPVELSIPAFKIKAQFLFGKVVLLAGGGSVNRLLNVMILRPNLAGVDFATGYIPDTAPVVQTTPQQLYTYGGSEGGDSAVARLTMFFRNTNPYGTGFLPDYRNTGWGVNFPTAADATSDAEFMRLTPELGKIVNAICTDPNTGGFASCSEDFMQAQTSPRNYLLAIHTEKISVDVYNGLDPLNEKPKYSGFPNNVSPEYYFKVNKAYVIFAKQDTPVFMPFCSSNFNLLTQTYVLNSKTYSVADKRACDCGDEDLNSLYNYDNGTLGLIIPTADRAQLFDYCISNATTTQTSPLGSSSNKGVENKRKWLDKAVRERPRAPTSGIIIPPTSPISDVTFVSTP